MGVYIKNAKMPMNCAGCPRKDFFATASEYRCREIPRPIRSLYLSNPFRPEWCPLHEIKEPHGRLGDLDELIGSLRSLGASDNEPTGEGEEN